MDIVIDKPARISGYALHRMVEQHQQGVPALWADEGSRLRIRPRTTEAPAYESGTLLGFAVTACVALKSNGKHRYLPLEDWRGRRTWLERQGGKHGFEVLGVHVEPRMQKIETHDGRRFRIDATDFTGLLRVTDPAAFGKALTNGIGRVGKAFGLNLLLVQ
jgi:CRISPR-associated protein Cas6/Cse3/CasE subtype I-E